MIKEAKEKKRIEQDLNNIIPADVIRHILGFFEGIVSSVSRPDFKEVRECERRREKRSDEALQIPF